MPLILDEPVTAGDLLSLDELRHFRQTSAARSILLVAHAWVVIATAFGFYVWRPTPATFIVAVVVIGARQLGLMVLMHEAAHWLLFATSRGNTWVGTWFCAAPVAADLKAYRRSHHLHHRHTQQHDDPDVERAMPLPVTRGRLALALAADLCGWTAARRVIAWRPRSDGIAQGVRRMRAPLIANAVLFGILTAVGGPTFYLLMWVVPWATWFQLATRVRGLAEHGRLPGGDDPLRSTRTIGAGALARATIAPYSVNYHLEHHLAVFVPCWKLRELHALLMERLAGARIAQAASYWDVIALATSA